MTEDQSKFFEALHARMSRVPNDEKPERTEVSKLEWDETDEANLERRMAQD